MNRNFSHWAGAFFVLLVVCLAILGTCAPAPSAESLPPAPKAAEPSVAFDTPIDAPLDNGLTGVLLFLRRTDATSPARMMVVKVSPDPKARPIIRFYHLVPVGPVPDPPPPLPPPPTPDPNPFQPAAQWQAIVKPVAAIKLQKADARALATDVYGRASIEVMAGGPAIATTGDLRDKLIQYGKPLGLQGRYPELAKALEKILGTALSLENRPLDRVQSAALLQTLAWAVWEAGK
jgi:hypothetical protein